jgi:hypothetical protein
MHEKLSYVAIKITLQEATRLFLFLFYVFDTVMIFLFYFLQFNKVPSLTYLDVKNLINIYGDVVFCITLFIKLFFWFFRNFNRAKISNEVTFHPLYAQKLKK